MDRLVQYSGLGGEIIRTKTELRNVSQVQIHIHVVYCSVSDYANPDFLISCSLSAASAFVICVGNSHVTINSGINKTRTQIHHIIIIILIRLFHIIHTLH